MIWNEDRYGSLEVGKVADMVVLAEDPLSCDLDRLKDIRVESEAFNSRWRVKGSDQEFATVFLSPEMQRRLTDWPKGYWLAEGGGAIVVATKARLNPERLTTLIRLVGEVVGLVPAEMEMWGEADPSARA